MHAIFLADAHLRAEHDDNYRLLLKFLGELPGTADTIFILGDLFEFWMNYRSAPIAPYRPILHKLQELHDAGIAIHYFEGNHDFHLGPIFTETLRATVYRSPAMLNIDGKTVYVCHGDQVNYQDYGYRTLRFILHSRFVRHLAAVAPARLVDFIAEKMSHGSKSQYQQRKVRWDYPSILRSFAAKQLAKGCDMVVTAHFHTPLIERFGHGDNQLLVSLGDWITQFSYGEWDNGTMRLRTYSPGETPFSPEARIS